MKKLFIFLALLTAQASIPMPAAQTYSISKSTVWTTMTALVTLAGAITSGWVLKHYWDKYELEQTQAQAKQKFSGPIGGDDPLKLAGATLTEGLLKITSNEINNRFRERNKYSCLALAATGAITALWGIKSLLTTK